MQGNRIRNLPVIIALGMGIIIGTISYLNSFENRVIYLRTIAAIIIFYFIGILVRKTIDSIKTNNMESTAQKTQKGTKIDLVAGDIDEE